MKTVWKFPFNIDDNIEIEMPVGAEIINVDIQRQDVIDQISNGIGIGRSLAKEQPCMWALIDFEAPKEIRHFILAGTGHPLPEGLKLKHLGTFKMAGDRLIFHVFEKE